MNEGLAFLLKLIQHTLFILFCGMTGAVMAMAIVAAMLANEPDSVGVGWALMFFVAPVGFVFGFIWAIMTLANLGKP